MGERQGATGRRRRRGQGESRDRDWGGCGYGECHTDGRQQQNSCGIQHKTKHTWPIATHTHIEII